MPRHESTHPVLFAFCNFHLGLACLALCAGGKAAAQSPEWIWHATGDRAPTNGEVCFLRRSFDVMALPNVATLSVAADDDAILYLNGHEVMHAKGHGSATRTNVRDHIEEGINVIAIRASNHTSQAAVLLSLEMNVGKRGMLHVVSDTNWVTSEAAEVGWETPAFATTSWHAAHSFGKNGVEPWGQVALGAQSATQATNITTLPGYRVELLRSAQPGEGSWIAMTIDSKGRLILSPQEKEYGLFRATLDRKGQVKNFEQITTNVGSAMGMLYAFDSLYVSGIGTNGQGLYRLRDRNRDGTFEECVFLKKFDGNGEHGPHAIVLGPDKKLYIMNGNHTKLPEGTATNSPLRNYGEDFLLTRQWDAGGHAVGILAPGGYIERTDRDGKSWELICGGYRNSYDFDFNPDGEMVAFDSDMEWDWGMPWYKATRIVHSVSGADHGWRSGTSNLPEYDADTWPPTFNIGIGSPTGVKFGTKSDFPKAYRDAFFALDWSYGRIFAVHLQPSGSSYDASTEIFLAGKPLNVADLEFGRDGALYFVTGGRGTQAGLYRVSYDKKLAQSLSAAPPSLVGKIGGGTEHVATSKEKRAATKARKLRHELESFHGRQDPRAVKVAWPHLNSDDRFLRNAARVAIEWQPVDQWQARALAETNVNAGLTALLALARCGPTNSQRDLLLALKKFPLDSLSVTQQLAKLRVIELSFIRQGRPDADLVTAAIDKLNRQYPSTNEWVNRELCQLLIYLDAPDVISKTLALLERAPTIEEQAHYVFHLRNVTNGWTIEQRKLYFDWFLAAGSVDTRPEVGFHKGGAYHVWANQPDAARRHPAELVRWFHEAGRDYGDGTSYPKFLKNIRRDAIATLTDQERLALGDVLGEEATLSATPLTKERPFVRAWTMEDIEPLLGQVSSGRDLTSGKAAFNDAQCLLCHRFDNAGGAVGPELTAASSKYSRRDILESILNPSKVLSDQFQNATILKKDGDDITGRIMDEDSEKIVVQPSLLTPQRIEIKKNNIAERRASAVSPMPEGLADALTQEEILDLLAYIESGGRKTQSAVLKR